MRLTREEIEPPLFTKLKENQEKLKFLVNYAILAPSSHNSQPWLFRIKNSAIQVMPNFTRALPVSDPKKRQFFLSLGAAIANLKLAAAAYGLKFDVTVSAETEITAEFFFRDLTSPSLDLNTLQAIISRHNNRSAFKQTKIPETFIVKMKQIAEPDIQVSIIQDDQTKKKIKSIVLDSIAEAFDNRAFTKELSEWFHPSLKKYRDGFVGYNLGVPWIISFILPFLMRHFNIGKSQVKMHKAMLSQSPCFVILSSDSDNAAGWLRAGQVFEEIGIEAQKQSIAMGTLAAPIEIDGYHREISEVLNTAARPLFFFRMGYSYHIPAPSPRLLLEEVIKTS